jgi:GNAT superfamily N-acetyltransferase
MVEADHGVITGTFNAETKDLHIDYVGVAPEFKRQGIGSQLYADIIAAAEQHGEVRSVSGFMAMDNREAIDKAGGDIAASPRAIILGRLGFTEHTLTAGGNAVSRKPDPPH